jgi:DNA-binding response OmpR family regulator
MRDCGKARVLWAGSGTGISGLAVLAAMLGRENGTLDEKSKNILVVDDDDAIRQMVETLLAEEGYDVDSAANGEEAMRVVRQKPFDLVVLDIMMPVMDGWEVASRMLCEDKTRDIPIIFLTALSSYTDQLKGWRMGCFDYITKPFDIGLFMMRVRAALDGTSAVAPRPEVEVLVEKKMEQLLQLMSETLQRDFGLRRMGVVDVMDDYAVKDERE